MKINTVNCSGNIDRTAFGWSVKFPPKHELEPHASCFMLRNINSEKFIKKLESIAKKNNIDIEMSVKSIQNRRAFDYFEVIGKKAAPLNEKKSFLKTLIDKIFAKKNDDHVPQSQISIEGYVWIYDESRYIDQPSRRKRTFNNDLIRCVKNIANMLNEYY